MSRLQQVGFIGTQFALVMTTLSLTLLSGTPAIVLSLLAVVVAVLSAGCLACYSPSESTTATSCTATKGE